MFRRSAAIARLRRGPDTTVSARRRSLQRALLAAAVVVPTFSTAAWATSRLERIDAYWAAGRLDAEGNLSVREVIDYDFTLAPAGDRHGLERHIDDPAVSQVVVTAPARTPADVDDMGDRTWIRIGDPSRTVKGRERYALSYELGAVLEDGRLVWDGLGDGWDVPVGSAEIHLLSDRRLGDAQCSLGRRGGRGGCELDEVGPGHLRLTVHGLDEGTGITVSAAVGERLADPPGDPSPGSAPLGSWPAVMLRWLGLVGLSLTTAAAVTWLLRWFGRDRVHGVTAAAAAFPPPQGQPLDAPGASVDAATLADMAPPMVSPPPELSAAQAGVVYDDGVLSRHVAAWLLAEVVAGTLALEMPADEAEPPLLRRLAPGGPRAEEILDDLFGTRRELVLGPSERTAVSRAYRSISRQLEQWYADSGLQPKDRRRLIGAVGGAGTALGLASAAAMLFSGPIGNRVVEGIGWIPWVAALGFGVGMATGWGSDELTGNSPERSAAWLQVESFRKFLADSEAAHVERAAAMGILREYAPWATALGLAGHWSGLGTGAAANADVTDRALLEALPRLSTWMAEFTPQPRVTPTRHDDDDRRERHDRNHGFGSGQDSGPDAGGSGGGGPLVGSGRGGGGGGSW